MFGKRLRSVVSGLVVVSTFVVASVLWASPASANTYKGDIWRTSFDNNRPQGALHKQEFFEVGDAMIYVYMWGSDNYNHFDLYICRIGSDLGDHAYGEVDVQKAGGTWGGVAWGDEYNLGWCAFYQSANFSYMGSGTETYRFIVADNQGTTTVDKRTLIVHW